MNNTNLLPQLIGHLHRHQPQDDEPVLIMSESGMPILETMSGVTMPADYSFECINNYVHCENPDYEDLQNLVLGMASHMDQLEAQIAAARALGAAHVGIGNSDCSSVVTRNRIPLSDEDNAAFHKAAENRDQAVELPSGALMFINYGEGPQDYSDLDCPHCGGSGHKGDIGDTQPLITEAARDAKDANARRMQFLHSINKDAEGFEYGVAKARWGANGKVEFYWAASDHSDIDAAIAARKVPQ